MAEWGAKVITDVEGGAQRHQRQPGNIIGLAVGLGERGGANSPEAVPANRNCSAT
jgi:hypothetical protein